MRTQPSRIGASLASRNSRALGVRRLRRMAFATAQAVFAALVIAGLVLPVVTFTKPLDMNGMSSAANPLARRQPRGAYVAPCLAALEAGHIGHGQVRRG